MLIEYFKCSQCDQTDAYEARLCFFPGCPKEHGPYTEMVFVKPSALKRRPLSDFVMSARELLSRKLD